MDKQKIKKYILEKIKLWVFVLLWFLIWATISIYFSYANWNQGLLWELFYLKDNKPYMSWALAFEDWAIPWGKIGSGIDASKVSWQLTNATISSSKISWKINTSSLTWTLDISQLPDWVWWDAQSLSWRTVSSVLTNEDMKIPTSKAVTEKIAPLLNCSTSTPDYYQLPYTLMWQETWLITKTVTVTTPTIWSYKLSQNWKCDYWSFVKVWSETKSDITCNATTNVLNTGYNTIQKTGSWTVYVATKIKTTVNWITTYQKSFTCSNDAIWIDNNDEQAISISCDVDSYKINNTQCNIVTSWQYAAAWANIASNCTNKPANSVYSWRWLWINNCSWWCNSWYVLSWNSCLISCSSISVWQSCYPSWWGWTSYVKYDATSVFIKTVGLQWSPCYDVKSRFNNNSGCSYSLANVQSQQTWSDSCRYHWDCVRAF